MNKEKLPIRKNLRYKYYDYSNEGMYFITICIKDKALLLGNIEQDEYIKLSKQGIIAQNNLNKIEQIYSNVIVDEYIIMPNHIHMILEITNKKEITISRVIKQYKAKVSKELENSIWQKSFYERVIRNEKEYLKIKEYIQNNIINWKDDKYFS